LFASVKTKPSKPSLTKYDFQMCLISELLFLVINEDIQNCSESLFFAIGSLCKVENTQRV